MRYLAAADTGGTFTDVAVYDAVTKRVVYGKALTNYDDLVDGVIDGLADTGVGLQQMQLLKHGTTHVINILLQRSGARTALVTTRGFRDVIEIARGNITVPFRLDPSKAAPLVPRPLRFELDERMNPRGETVRPISEDQIASLAKELAEAGVEAVAVSLLNAYANPAHEEEAARLLSRELPGVYISTSTSLTRSGTSTSARPRRSRTHM